MEAFLETKCHNWMSLFAAPTPMENIQQVTQIASLAAVQIYKIRQIWAVLWPGNASVAGAQQLSTPALCRSGGRRNLLPLQRAGGASELVHLGLCVAHVLEEALKRALRLVLCLITADGLHHRRRPAHLQKYTVLFHPHQWKACDPKKKKTFDSMSTRPHRTLAAHDSLSCAHTCAAHSL